MIYGSPSFIPADHRLPVADFFLANPDQREAAMTWANGVFADLAHYRDADGLRACKVLVANRGDRMEAAALLARVLEKSCAEAA